MFLINFIKSPWYLEVYIRSTLILYSSFRYIAENVSSNMMFAVTVSYLKFRSNCKKKENILIVKYLITINTINKNKIS